MGRTNSDRGALPTLYSFFIRPEIPSKTTEGQYPSPIASDFNRPSAKRSIQACFLYAF